jgi:hypothetical protein
VAFWRHVPPGRLLTFIAIAALMVLLAACGTTSQTPAPTATSVPTVNGTPNSYTMKVYFAHHPETDTQPDAVLPVERTLTALPTPTAALEAMFRGPTADERSGGYYSPFDGMMSLISYCPGDFKDFTLLMGHRGTTSEQGTLTVTLCRTVMMAGDLDGARMSAMIQQTLLQFPDIKKVVILTHEGTCFNDLRGDNACLNP